MALEHRLGLVVAGRPVERQIEEQRLVVRTSHQRIGRYLT
jgi:hypothetical protein